MNRTHEGVSGYIIFTCFHGLMGDQRTLEFWEVTFYFHVFNAFLDTFLFFILQSLNLSI